MTRAANRSYPRPLVGRDGELSRLCELIADVGTRGGALVVRGEPGIGKSALLAAAAARARETGMVVRSTVGAVLAATQEPLSASALGEMSTAPAWATIPSWDVIGTADHVIPPAGQEFMAARAHAEVTMVDASHLSMLSHPGLVASVIEQAARRTS